LEFEETLALAAVLRREAAAGVVCLVIA